MQRLAVLVVIVAAAGTIAALQTVGGHFRSLNRVRNQSANTLRNGTFRTAVTQVAVENNAARQLAAATAAAAQLAAVQAAAIQASVARARGESANAAPATRSATGMPTQLRHLVLYKFKPEITPAQVQEVIDAFAALPSKIDTIVSLEHGPNVSTEGKSDGLTYGFLVTFADTAGRDKYLKHPAHDAYVKVVKDRREKVIVFDYWTNGESVTAAVGE